MAVPCLALTLDMGVPRPSDVALLGENLGFEVLVVLVVDDGVILLLLARELDDAVGANGGGLIREAGAGARGLLFGTVAVTAEASRVP